MSKTQNKKTRIGEIPLPNYGEGNWFVPAGVVEELEKYVIKKYGSERHYGAVALKAMRNHIGKDEDLEILKAAKKIIPNDCQEIETIDRGDERMNTEMVQFHFSTVEEDIDEFRDWVDENAAYKKYGQELGLAILREIEKDEQKTRLIENRESKSPEEDFDINELKLSQNIAIDPQKIDGDSVKSSPDYRIPVIAAMLRSSGEDFDEKEINKMSRKAGANSPKTRKNDVSELTEYLKEGEINGLQMSFGRKFEMYDNGDWFRAGNTVKDSLDKFGIELDETYEDLVTEIDERYAVTDEEIVVRDAYLFCLALQNKFDSIEDNWSPVGFAKRKIKKMKAIRVIVMNVCDASVEHGIDSEIPAPYDKETQDWHNADSIDMLTSQLEMEMEKKVTELEREMSN